MMFSIVVPIYNVEKYLEKCIKSIGLQTFTDYEAILVNDCSTDNSLMLAESLASKSTQIRVIDKQKNTGLSDTRNIGIKSALGDYIVFLDSDDYIEIDTLETFSQIINKYHPDIIYGGYILENEQGQVIKKYGFLSEPDKLYCASDYMQLELEKRNLFASAAFGVYRREFLVENSLYFKTGILHEDEQWTPRVLMQATTIYLSSKFFYHYYKRQGSITTRMDRTKNGLDLIDTCNELDQIADSRIKDDKLLRLYKNHLAKLYMKAVSIGKIYRINEKKDIDRSFPLQRACNRKDIAKAIIFRCSIRLYTKLNSVFGDDWR